MKTTLHLDVSCCSPRSTAPRRGTTLTAAFEEALRTLLTAPSPAASPFRMRVVAGSRPPAVDVADKDALVDLLDESR